MADAINRIVSSSVAVERSAWKEKEGQREKRKDADALAQGAEKTGADSTNVVESSRDATLDDKGKHVDISAFIDV
jgi:hypothetical protein